MIKKFAAVFTAFALTFTFTACSNANNAGAEDEKDKVQEEIVTEEITKPEEEYTEVRALALSGPTGMGFAKFMSDIENGEIDDGNYSIEIVSSVDEVTPKIVQGEVDIAAVPANLASVLWNNTDGDIEILSINTLGVLYIVEAGERINSVEDLKGQTIFASGKGATPEIALYRILEENGIDPEKDVNIEWKSEHAECVQSLLTTDAIACAMLPQPFVTVAQTQNEDIRIALDVEEEWEKLDANSEFVTGVLIARKGFADDNPEALKKFMSHYEESVNYVNNNIDEAAALIDKAGIVPEAVAKKAIPYCNIVFITGEKMKATLSDYFNVLYEVNPKMVGGNLPQDEIFYMD